MRVDNGRPLLGAPRSQREACNGQPEALNYLAAWLAHAILRASGDELEQSTCNRGPTRLCRAERARACHPAPSGESSWPMSDFETRTPASSQSGQREEITVGRTSVLTGSGEEAEVFTMTLGGETIDLLPLRNWSQLDVYKWRARGKVPGTPAGLEITFDHVKVAGETVSTKDPEGTAKLRKLLNEWLALGRGTQELALQKAHPKQTPVEQAAPVRPRDSRPALPGGT